MKPWEVFNYIKSASYNCSGKSVNWVMYADHAEKKVYLLFQETDGLYDWSVNLNFIKRKYVQPYKNQETEFYLHEGWANAWKSANDEIMSSFIAFCQKYPDYEVWIGGWSYGGAMAQIAGEDYNYRVKNMDNPTIQVKPNLITFGSPKPLYGKATQKYFQNCFNKVYQFTNVNDLVTKVPPFADYYRVGTTEVEVDVKVVWYRVINPWRYHTRYGLESIYPEEIRNAA